MQRDWLGRSHEGAQIDFPKVGDDSEAIIECIHDQAGYYCLASTFVSYLLQNHSDMPLEVGPENECSVGEIFAMSAQNCRLESDSRS